MNSSSRENFENLPRGRASEAVAGCRIMHRCVWVNTSYA